MLLFLRVCTIQIKKVAVWCILLFALFKTISKIVFLVEIIPVMEVCGQQLLSPPISVHSENLLPLPPTLDIGQDEIQHFPGDDMVCDDCQMPKRYPRMAWWWDKQCVMNICEHCGVLKHRNHELLLHSEAERRANDDYNNFYESTSSLVADKLADCDKAKEFVDSFDSMVNDVDRFQNGKQKLVENLEIAVENAKEDMSILCGAHLNHAFHEARRNKRKSVTAAIDAVSTILCVLHPRLKNLLALFGEMKTNMTILNKFQHIEAKVIDDEEYED